MHMYNHSTWHDILHFGPQRHYTHLADPHGHLVGVGGAVVQVEHDHAEDDRKGDEDHGEHDVIDDDRNAQWGFRNFVSQQQQEHSEGEQDVDGQTHLLSW